MAMEMGFSENEAASYGQANRLHDIGKVGILLSRDQHFSLAHDVALNCHERWDGKGYPAGIPVHELPLATRIVSAVDIFDALISRRHYKDVGR